MTGDGFSSPISLERTRTTTKHALEMAETALGSLFLQSDTQLLATLVVRSPSDGPVKILDFGGGMGIGYVHLAQAVTAPSNIAYHVIDNATVCSEGRRLLAEQRNVTFDEHLPPAGEVFDIVYASSSIQYVDDLEAVLTRFTSYKPRSILLADVPTGTQRDFWTAQPTPFGALAYHILNLETLVRVLAKHDYTLRVKGVARRYIVSPQPGLRIDRTLNLLFER